MLSQVVENELDVRSEIETQIDEYKEQMQRMQIILKIDENKERPQKFKNIREAQRRAKRARRSRTGAYSQTGRPLHRLALHLQAVLRPMCLSYHQTGPMQARHDTANVPGPQRPHTRLQSECPVFGRSQAKRRPGNNAGSATSRLFLVHLKVQAA
jgi:hypothetical protein